MFTPDEITIMRRQVEARQYELETVIGKAKGKHRGMLIERALNNAILLNKLSKLETASAA